MVAHFTILNDTRRSHYWKCPVWFQFESVSGTGTCHEANIHSPNSGSEVYQESQVHANRSQP